MEFIVAVSDGDEDVCSGPRSPATMDGVFVSSCHLNIPEILVIVIFFFSLSLDIYLSTCGNPQVSSCL
jgi:hypothetical protein